MSKYLNKKLSAAIKADKPLKWEYGDYGKYYTGLCLFAYSGYAETTGRVYRSIVYANQTIGGAKAMCATLDKHLVRYEGFEEAVRDFEEHEPFKPRPVWKR